MTEKGEEIKYLENNFISAYQEFLFDREEDKYDLDNVRLCLAIKYLISKKQSDELALSLLNNDLDEYSESMKTRGPLQRKESSRKPKKICFQSGLTSPEDVIKYIAPLPCQSDPLKSCKRVPDDSDIASIIGIWNRLDSKSKVNVKTAKVPITNANTLHQTISLDVAKKEEKRKQFVELYEKYSRKSKIRSLDEELNPPSKVIKTETKPVGFKSATTLSIEEKKQNAGKQKKTLGGKPLLKNPFVCPIKKNLEKENAEEEEKKKHQDNEMEVDDERLKNIDPRMIELIKNEIMDSGSVVSWNDIAGLEASKRTLQEVIVFPMLRPDIFVGLRGPPKGVLLFGPPGTGKTLIGKCIASQSKSTFFSISASSLTSKWVGEGEKMVRALFAVARVYQPSVIFIDELDSLLTQRSETEHESSRRIKTEFLVQLDGATTDKTDRVLVIGATNRPQELDEAARRRFVKRLYIPLPEYEARKQLIINLLNSEHHNLTPEDIEKIAELSDNYSGADMANLCKEASMGPIRSISFDQLQNIKKEDVRCVTADDFYEALNAVRPSVSQADLGIYVKWDSTYGSGTAEKRR